jgi:hypothetical protein
MKSWQTVVGVLVLAVVVGGVFWARARSGSTAGHGAGGAAATNAAADDETLPDVTLAEATSVSGEVRLTLSVSPTAPAGAASQWPLAFEQGRVSFEMTMPMGDHTYSLVPAGGGGYEADVTLPLCKSGKRRWYATVEGRAAGQPVTARFRLDLAVPGAQ